MNREEALTIWAPEGSPWSPWTKAVLFAFMPEEIPDTPPSTGESWQIPLIKEAALIVDLPGARSVGFGVSAARSGYRPIPLYNACPSPTDTTGLRATTSSDQEPLATAAGVRSAIEVVPIMRALERETNILKGLILLPSAPPAFLLDADRHRPALLPSVGWFDNRSVIRPSDVPTATFLKGHGIERVVVVQAKPDLQSDLRTILLAWQAGGLAISRQVLAEQWNPQIFAVTKPSLLKIWWDKLVVRFRYPLNGAGSFGRFAHGSAG